MRPPLATNCAVSRSTSESEFFFAQPVATNQTQDVRFAQAARQIIEELLRIAPEQSGSGSPSQ